MQKGKCEAVIFDMDGLMIDSEPIWRKSQIKCFKRVGINLSIEDCHETTGVRISEIVNFRYSQQPWNEKQLNISRCQLSEMIVNQVIEYVLDEGQPMEGLQSALDYFVNKGYKLAVASSSGMSLIKATMKRLSTIIENISKIEYFVSAEFLDHGKPHPEVYLIAAQKLNVQPVNCLAIEDSLTGTISAKSAKMRCISIPWDFPNQSKHFQVADEIIGSLNNINDELLSKIWGNGNKIKQGKDLFTNQSSKL